MYPVGVTEHRNRALSARLTAKQPNLVSPGNAFSIRFRPLSLLTQYLFRLLRDAPSRYSEQIMVIMIRVFFNLAIVTIASTAFLLAQPPVLTWHNDNGRTGQNLQETILSPATVNSASFGRLATISVDGKVDAQPLYVPSLAIPGQGMHNVLYVATEHDSIYAFDADTFTQLLHVSLAGAGETPSDDRGCGQVTPEIGITATPAIDLGAGPHVTIYLVAMSQTTDGQYHQRLHALDLTTLGEEFNGPVDIAATAPGSGVE